MDTADRIDILRRSGFSQQTTAAILGVDAAEVHAFASDPTDVPELPSGGDGGGDGGGEEAVAVIDGYFDIGAGNGDRAVVWEDFTETAVIEGIELDGAEATIEPGVYIAYLNETFDASIPGGTQRYAQLRIDAVDFGWTGRTPDGIWLETVKPEYVPDPEIDPVVATVNGVQVYAHDRLKSTQYVNKYVPYEGDEETIDGSKWAIGVLVDRSGAGNNVVTFHNDHSVQLNVAQRNAAGEEVAVTASADNNEDIIVNNPGSSADDFFICWFEDGSEGPFRVKVTNTANLVDPPEINEWAMTSGAEDSGPRLWIVHTPSIVQAILGNDSPDMVTQTAVVRLARVGSVE